MFIVKHKTYKGKDEKPVTAKILTAETLDKAISEGMKWLKEHKFPVEHYYRYWTEGNVTTVDYGSWSSFLEIHEAN